ncbi:ectonucleotide pyrophosphatase/phosphodiesterase family member 7-like [Saccoglossus kowalevskii]|uniref:Ectonucleotide pyrophosphatase/phosphodiesterase family member 7-like n=1 Tax=Saccoglossus kowalevskii TaxID=10224 RepID=A0ABM0GK49_SACKO|nr:PREDICTED: ectonucleotide pyrophosphatase/phosphodiesterase family member 7-like [Saccoglossus kowalevskii]
MANSVNYHVLESEMDSMLHDTDDATLKEETHSHSIGMRKTPMKSIIIMVLSIVLVLLILVVIGVLSVTYLNCQDEKPKIIVVLVDGLRWDLYNVSMSALKSVAENGVRAESMVPTFPSLSSPNMYSIATGLFSESHGVVHNLVFDVENKTQSHSFEEGLTVDYWWDQPGVEPLWITARRAGFKTGTIMYPGGSVSIKEMRPNKNVFYSFNATMKDGVDIAIEWLIDDDLDLVFLYNTSLDDTLHQYGVNSPQADAVVKEMDDGLGYLLQKLENHTLANSVNVIVVSDHGHHNITEVVPLFGRGVNRDDFEFYLEVYGPMTLLQPKEEKMDDVYETLKKIEHFHVYKKEEIPKDLHYRNNERIPSMLILGDLGTVLNVGLNSSSTVRSTHGWNSSYMEMHSVFYAQGPAFKEGFMSKSFTNVDVYPLMCKILGVTPRPNNGTLDIVQNMLTT